MRTTKTIYVGKFQVRLDELDVIGVPPVVRAKLEEIANNYPTRSAIVRFDMAPWQGKGVPPIYEIETAPGGLMFNFPRFPWERLMRLADTAICLVRSWAPAYEVLAEKTGWELCFTWPDTVGRIYFSGQSEDVPEGANVVTDPQCSKVHIIPVTGGELIGPDTPTDFGVLRGKYPNGFVVKPVWGWGSRDIYMYPTQLPFSNYARPKMEVKRVIQRARTGEGEEWLIQPFFPPELFSGDFTIWRIYAMRDTDGGGFKLLGGTWNCRPHLKVHGASDNVIGEIRV